MAGRYTISWDEFEPDWQHNCVWLDEPKVYP
jgi:hypothetical protein